MNNDPACLKDGQRLDRPYPEYNILQCPACREVYFLVPPREAA